VPARHCCCTSQAELSASAMDMAVVEHGLSPGGFLKELSIRAALGQEDEEVEVDYDAQVASSLRDRSRTDKASRRKLLRAARSDDAPTVLQLVAEGADLIDVGEALRLASYRGSACVVRELVAVGLSVNEACPNTGLTPLQLAAGGGQILVCELLLDAMADVQAQGPRGPTALSLARRKGHTEVEEVIERHVAALLLVGKGEEPEDGGQYRRAHVLPRVSPVLSEAVMQASPFQPLAADEAQEPDAAAGSGACPQAGSPPPADDAAKEAVISMGSPWREDSAQGAGQVMPL